ncbi:MAG: hypothetical protein ACF8XB_06250 [Planctomycetota bacterium JB042]
MGRSRENAAWIIEHKTGTGFGVKDGRWALVSVSEAFRFARRIDAERMLAASDPSQREEFSVTEHSWPELVKGGEG